MAERIDTANEFVIALDEVELLLAEAEQASPGSAGADERRAAVMNKSALLLLMGKFEAFLEGAAQEFLFALNAVKAKGMHLPVRILVEHSVRAVREAEQRLNRGDLDGLSELFGRLGRRWVNIDPCVDLDVSCKFNYGQHGESEIVRLYKRIGFEDVFATVVVCDDAEAYEGGLAEVLDVKGIVNSLTNIRNNILHQDATPSLTTGSLRKRVAALQRFAVALTAALQAVVDQVEGNAIGEEP